MPRQQRLDTPRALHNIMGRGITGLDVFSSVKDREDFLVRIKDLCEIFSDERILGSSEFVKDIIAEAEERDKETLLLNPRISDLRSLAKEVCKEEGVEESYWGGGKRKGVVKARRLFCQITLKKDGAFRSRNCLFSWHNDFCC